MSDSTVYDIKIQYLLDDRASSGLDHLSSKADEAGHHAEGLKETLKGIGEAFLLGEAFHKGKELFVDYNREMESMRISAATMLQANHLAKTFDEATVKARALTDEYQRFAVTSPVTTKDINEFSNGIQIAVAQAGGGLDKIQQFAEQGVIAAKAFGERSDVAARQISEAIGRGAHANEMFSRTLVTTQGVTLEAFNKMSSSSRSDLLLKALSSDAIVSAAKAFGDSFEGVTSTLVDNIEIGFGKIGLPLFKAITAEVAQWNAWIENHPKEIQEFSETFSKALVDGFRAVKDAVGFLLDHKDALIKIAELWALTKVGGGLPGLLGGSKGPTSGVGAAIGGVDGVMKGFALGTLVTRFEDVSMAAQKLNVGMQTVEGGLSALPGPIGQVSGALLGLHAGLQLFADWVDKTQRSQIDSAVERDSLAGIFNRHQGQDDRINIAAGIYRGTDNAAGGVPDKEQAQSIATSRADILDANTEYIAKVRELGAYTQQGTFDMAAFSTKIQAFGFNANDAAAITRSFAENMELLAKIDPEGLKRRLGIAAAPTSDRGSEAGKKAAPQHVNVHINRIEVQSDDPDRFVFGLVRSFSSAARNPAGARGQLRGGF